MSLQTYQHKNKLPIFLLLTLLTIMVPLFLSRTHQYEKRLQYPFAEKKIVHFDNTQYLTILLNRGVWMSRITGNVTKIGDTELNLKLKWRRVAWPSITIGENRTHFSENWNDLISIEITDNVSIISYGENRDVLWTRESNFSQE